MKRPAACVPADLEQAATKLQKEVEAASMNEGNIFEAHAAMGGGGGVLRGF